MDYPLVLPLQASNAGNGEAFVTALNSTGTGLAMSTFLGGSAADQGNGIALSALGTSAVVGTTSSTDFPSVNAYQPANGGNADAFLVKLGPPAPVEGPPPALVVTTSDHVCLCPQDGGEPVAAAGGDPAQEGYSAGGVRYADGVLRQATTDLGSHGFGTAWGLSRSWSNGPGYAMFSSNGAGWFDAQLPVLELVNGTSTLAVVTSASNARYFDLVNGVYQERFFLPDVLTANTALGEYVLTDPTGAQVRFYDYANSRPVNQRGQFKSYTDPDGNVTAVVSSNAAGQPLEVQRSVTSGGTTTVESYLYSYVASGLNAGLLASGVLRRQVNGGAWSTVRQASYAYYDGSQSFGNLGDLRTVTIQDGAGTTLDTEYYRYYVPGDSGGYVHGLKYAFGAAAYARLAAALASPLSATDSQVAPYADLALQYDAQQRITQEVVPGAGTTLNGGNGLGTYSYSYTASSNAAGFNNWAMKTVETLPDGNQNIVYTNAYGEVMLAVYHDVSSNLNWESFHKYDGQGRILLTANPSALTGWDESKADLLNSQSGNYQYLSDSQGLVAFTDYYSATTAGETTAGGVAGYVQDNKLQQGELGSAVLQDSVQYFAHAAYGTTVAPVASSTVYRNSDGTGAQTTSSAYSWFTGTAQLQSETDTLPVISAAQNGPGSADVETTYFDSYGEAVWHKDGDGFLTYTAYDPATGAVVKTIDDVNTIQTADFSNLPSGWTTPTGGGLELISQMVVDALGRDTKLTDPNGNVSYTVYNDTNYEMLVYPGWNSSTNLPTGPTLVTREDRPGSYVETVTMTAPPHLTGGVPDGSEAISNLQSLARAYTNSTGQVVHADAYFNLSGVSWSTAANLGTLNSNYYRTLTDYDNRGRPARVQSPTGTIDRTVYDGQDRVVSTWEGTTDTPASGQWSPTNNTSPANLVQLSGDVYDGGGVGDSNLTQATAYPGGSAAARVSQFFFDWRNRQVASKDGVQGSEDTTTHRPITYVTYDNLDQATSVQQYDGDGVTLSSSNGVPVAPSASLLRAQSNTAYDDQGRAYQSQVFSVNPSTGAVSTAALTTNVWYGHRGQALATAEPGGLVTKTQDDGAGRATIQYVTDGAGGSTWAAAGTVTGDNVLEQTETIYDAASNPIQGTVRQRNHDETATGALGNPSTSPKARVSYSASYYDAANRLTGTVDVGTNGGSAWSRPGTLPAASDTSLVVSYGYTPAGEVGSVTDPRGIVTQSSYDALGQLTQTIEAYTDGTPTSTTNKTTQYTYDGAGHLLTLTAVEPAGALQKTQYVYGVSTATGSDLNSNDLLAAVQHPDKSTGQPSASEQDSYTVNALGETKTATDRNGTVHTIPSKVT